MEPIPCMTEKRTQNIWRTVFSLQDKWHFCHPDGGKRRIREGQTKLVGTLKKGLPSLPHGLKRTLEVQMQNRNLRKTGGTCKAGGTNSWLCCMQCLHPVWHLNARKQQWLEKTSRTGEDCHITLYFSAEECAYAHISCAVQHGLEENSLRIKKSALCRHCPRRKGTRKFSTGGC